MYDIISQIIDHNWTQGDLSQQYIMYICSCLIILFTIFMFDSFKQFISEFVRR